MPNRLLDDFAEISSDWIWETDPDHRFTFISPRAKETIGDPDWFVGRCRLDLADSENCAADLTAHFADLDARRSFKGFAYRLKREDGARFWVRISGRPTYDEAGAFLGYQGIGTDITVEQAAREEASRANAALRRSNQELENAMLRLYADIAIREEQQRELRIKETMFEQVETLAQIGAWHYDFDAKKITFSPQVYCFYELDPSVEPTREIIFSAYDEAARAVLEAAIDHAVETRERFDIVTEFTTLTGRRRWIRTIGQVEFAHDRPHRIFGVSQDVTAERERADFITRLAQKDALTGLDNRARFSDALSQAIRDVDRQGGELSLCVIDLDRFKDVNDTLGHGAGDAVLRAIADRLERMGKGAHIAARLGGDELAFVITRHVSGDDRERILKALARIFAEPVAYDGDMIPISGCIGVAHYPSQACNMQELMRNADFALYDAKRQGRSMLAHFHRGLTERAAQHVKMLADLATALETDALIPYYQPVVNLERRRIEGFEALLRWRCPERGVISAGAFFEAFTNRELGPRITETLLTHVLRDVQRWVSAGLKLGRVSVNLSELDLASGDFARRLLQRLDDHAIDVRNFCIEITENTVIEDEGDIVRYEIDRLAEAGVAIALDDFGTGFASLSHLKTLPVNILKIDKSFVRDIPADEANSAIVELASALGRKLNYYTVAEGIETREQLKALIEAGCQLGQGFLFSKAVPAEDVPALIEQSLDHFFVDADIESDAA